MVRNPGQPASIYEIAEFVEYAHRRAITPANIIAGFNKTGIYPFDRNVFSDEDFLSSAVTDRLAPDENGTPIYDSNVASDKTGTPAQTGTPTHDSDVTPARTGTPINDSNVTSAQIRSPICDSNATPARTGTTIRDFDATPALTETPSLQTFLSPQQFRGYPKAGKRKASSNGRQKGRSLIATDTPEKILLEAKASKRKATTTEKPKPKKKICVSKPSTINNKSKQTSKRQKAHNNNAIDNIPCTTCNIRFCDDKSGGKWVQCQTCQKWYHNACQGLEERNYKTFICIECDN